MEFRSLTTHTAGTAVGWKWGIEKISSAHHNTIEFNHVHDLVHGVLSDAGLIYCLGVSPGSVIELPLRGLGIHNFYLRVHILVGEH